MSEISLNVAPSARAYGPSIEDAPELAAEPIVEIKKVTHAFPVQRRVAKAHTPALRKAQTVVIATPPKEIITQTQSAQELLVLRALHEQVTGHFMLSMTLDSEAALALVHSADHSNRAKRVLASETQQDGFFEPAQLAPISHFTMTTHQAPSSGSRPARPPRHRQDRVRVTQAAAVAQEPEKPAPSVGKTTIPALQEVAEELPTMRLPLAPSAAIPALPQEVKNDPLYQPDYSAVITQARPPQNAQPPQILDPVAPSDAPKIAQLTPQFTPPLPAVLTTQVVGVVAHPPMAKVTTQPAPAPEAPRLPAVIAKTDTPPTAVDYSVLNTHLQSLKASAATLNLPQTPANPVSEAFDWVTSVSNAVVTQMTFEGSESHSFWVKAEAPEHIPTWIRRNSNPEEAIPLISNNAGRLLSKMAGATLQTEAALVFGKVPSGWSVRLSGRSERPLFLNAQNQTVSSQQVEGDRYFAFLNVEPGAHLLYLLNKSGTEVGAVGVSALTGSASYLNLNAISFIQVKGHVYDGSEAYVKPMVATDVRVLGSVTTHTQTDETGSFLIDHVLSVADYPIYLETDAQNGFTHRYQVSPATAAQLALYRLNEKTIQAWVSQLEGSISPESGLVVAAAPNLVSGAGANAKLSPAVHSLAASPTLRPEVYTLAGDATLQVSKPLDLENSRFISVQVSEGPIEVSLLDAKGSAAWSEIFMASPAVINMIGPL